MSDDADYINTNILGSDNIGAQIAQDIIVTTVVTSLVEDAVRGTVYNFGGKQALQAGFGRFDSYFTKEMVEKLSKASTQKVTGSISQKLGKTFAKRSAKAALGALGKTATTGAVRAGATTAGGCTLGPAGCAAGAALGGMIFVADLAFTVFTTIQDIQDKSGILNIFHKAEIEAIAKDFKDSLNAGYAEMGYPDLMEEEVMFYPENFVFDFKDDGSITLDPNNEWVQKYVEYRNEYLKNNGVADGWEQNIQPETIEAPKNVLNKPKGGSSVLLSLSSSCMCLLLLFSLLLI